MNQQINNFQTQINLLQINCDEYKAKAHQAEAGKTQIKEKPVSTGIDKALYEEAMVEVARKSLQVVVLME